MTVEEWLGENNQLGIDIWHKKYQQHDETFNEWLDRVSGENDEVRDLIKDKKFLFGGRILSNRGVKDSKVTYSNCFVGGTKVITKRGIINIEDVRIGDEVITSNDTWQSVNDVMCRDYIGDLYRIKSNMIYDDILCTPNHKFLTRYGWKRADSLKYSLVETDKPDFLKLANRPDYAEIQDIIVEKNMSCKVYNLSVENNHSYTANGVVVHNCYVVTPPEDNIESIFESRKKLARTYSYGGGCGLDLSKLAPAGAKVRNQARMTSGAVSFMEGFSQTTEEIGQNGRRKNSLDIPA